MINWKEEVPQINKVALLCGVDPFFVAAIRAAENGGPGKEYGVMNGATSYYSQLHITCNSIRNRIIDFNKDVFTMKKFIYGSRACYSSAFILNFQKRWCPIGAENDPDNLNKNWYGNVIYFYDKFCKQGEIA